MFCPFPRNSEGRDDCEIDSSIAIRQFAADNPIFPQLLGDLTLATLSKYWPRFANSVLLCFIILTFRSSRYSYPHRAGRCVCEMRAKVPRPKGT